MARFTWRSRSELDEAELQDALASLRARRQQALRDSDWTQLPDAPLTGAERAAWAQHRQALRDLPSQAQGRSASEVRATPLPDPPGA